MQLPDDHEAKLATTRRYFFSLASTGIGAAALASLVNPAAFASSTMATDPKTGGLAGLPPRRSTCSITNQSCEASKVPTCRIRSARVSASQE
jgi:hypothetical protein